MRKTEWIYIIEPDGKGKIASPSYIRKLLSLNKSDNSLENTIMRLEDRLNKTENRLAILEIPMKKQKIIELLENGERHNGIWIINRVEEIGWYMGYRIIDELVEEDVLTITKSGAQVMYSIKEGKVNEKER